MKCIYYYKASPEPAIYNCINCVLCGNTTFWELLHPSDCSRVETFMWHMYIFCWIAVTSTVQQRLHVESHVLQSWSKPWCMQGRQRRTKTMELVKVV